MTKQFSNNKEIPCWAKWLIKIGHKPSDFPLIVDKKFLVRNSLEIVCLYKKEQTQNQNFAF